MRQMHEENGMLKSELQKYKEFNGVVPVESVGVQADIQVKEQATDINQILKLVS